MTKRLRVVALTGDRVAPGARFRVHQLIPALEREGLDVDLQMAPVSSYPPSRRWLRPAWMPATLAARVPGIVATFRGDVTLFQREFVSTLATLEMATARPRVFDVDDAIWLNRRNGGFARRLAGAMDIIVAGNAYLAAWFGQYCPHVEIVPTSVDTDRFVPAGLPTESRPPALGWTGVSSNFPYLGQWEEGLAAVMAKVPDLRLRVCADRPPRLDLLPTDRVDWVPWTPAAEVPFLQSLDIGLMPLDDTPWARGKCSFKMLQYLACGVPAVVSPVGMNRDVLDAGPVGRAAETAEEAAIALLDLLDDEDARRSMGAAGRRLVCERYSVEVVAPRLAAILRGAAQGAPGTQV